MPNRRELMTHAVALGLVGALPTAPAQAQAGRPVAVAHAYVSTAPRRRLVVTVRTTDRPGILRIGIEEGGRHQTLRLRADPARLARVAEAVQRDGGTIRVGSFRAGLRVRAADARVTLTLPGGGEASGAQTQVGPVAVGAAAVVVAGVGFVLGFGLTVAGGVAAVAALAATGQIGNASGTASGGGEDCDCEIEAED